MTIDEYIWELIIEAGIFRDWCVAQRSSPTGLQFPVDMPAEKWAAAFRRWQDAPPFTVGVCQVDDLAAEMQRGATPVRLESSVTTHPVVPGATITHPINSSVVDEEKP